MIHVPNRRVASVLATTVCLAVISASRSALAAEAYTPFEGEKSAWRGGFDRYDFVMDEATLAIAPFKAPEGEKFAVGDPARGQRRCVVIVPRKVAEGRPWSWRGCYWDHEPQTEVELLRRGFHIAYISANATLKPGKEWDVWYAHLTGKHGLSKKPAFIGMSRGGEYAYTWATQHPENVSCIYGDNPGANPEVFSKLGLLARQDVPLLHVCGSIDPVLGKNSTPIEGIYQHLGGRISVMIKEGAGHHPHSLRDSKPIADFIEQSVNEKPAVAPPYLAGTVTRSSFYSTEDSYREFPGERTHVTCRGPLFSECYSRYTFALAGVEGPVTVIEPKSPAAGMPWVLRSSFVPRDSRVDLELLGKGLHVVTGPVPFNADGPIRAHWDAVYKHLTDHGYSRRPVMEGAGGAAGDVCAWATQNPDKVSCIYAVNAVLRSTMASSPLLENLAPLAQASVPFLLVCGSLDPALDKNSRALEKRYKGLGGRVDLIIQEGEGHFVQPADFKRAVDFILRNANEAR